MWKDGSVASEKHVHFLCLALQIRMHNGDMVVAADYIPQCREPLLYPLDFHRVRERVAQVLQFLVCGGGGHEETLAVTVMGKCVSDCVRICQYPWTLSSFFFDTQDIESGRLQGWICAYPTVNRPRMRVPAMVAWQMGMTSWSSDSKTLA